MEVVMTDMERRLRGQCKIQEAKMAKAKLEMRLMSQTELDDINEAREKLNCYLTYGWTF